MSTQLEYAVGEGNIYLETTIGNLQVGTSQVSLDGRTVFRGSGPSKVLVGSGATVVDKVLGVVTIVSQVNATSNQLVVTYRLSGGPRDFQWVVSNSTERGGMRLFNTTVRLTR